MASNQLSNDQNDNDGQSKIALITGITGQVDYLKLSYYASVTDAFDSVFKVKICKQNKHTCPLL